MSRVHHLRAAEGIPARIPDDAHLEYLLDEAEAAFRRGRPPVAITNLAQAVFVAHMKPSRLSELELLQRVKRIIDRYGGIA